MFPAKWTGDVKKAQHNYGISMADLAAESGMNQKYLSTVLNSSAVSKKTKEKIESAIKRLVEQRKGGADG